jgi:hypothetical protein
MRTTYSAAARTTRFQENGTRNGPISATPWQTYIGTDRRSGSSRTGTGADLIA